MKYNLEEIKAILPHRPPFLFLDEVEFVNLPLEFEAKNEVNLPLAVNGELKAFFEIKEDLDILSGHFPGNPVLPGVVQIEMMAQAACVMIAPTIKEIEKVKLRVALLTVQSAKFRKPALPGMKLEIYVKCLRARRSMLTYQGRIECDGVVLSEAEFMASCEEDRG